MQFMKKIKHRKGVFLKHNVTFFCIFTLSYIKMGYKSKFNALQ